MSWLRRLLAWIGGFFMPPAWETVIEEDTGIIHVLPIDDLREHAWHDECWCRPRWDEEEPTALLIHNSMDRREEYETGRKPS